MARRGTILSVTLISVAAAIAVLLSSFFFNHRKDQLLESPLIRSAVPLAVLGDSDSHSYHDQILISEKTTKGLARRGGKFRPTTWQWTEILAQLRGRYIDQGDWGGWGTPVKIAETLDWVGWGGRAPRKQDYRFNFAVSAANCQDLMSGYYRQAPRLLSLMDRDPGRWKNGIVSIRIGVNTIGQIEALDRFAKDGVTPSVRMEILRCVDWIRQAVDLIRHSHPQTRFVLVGILDNVDWPPYFDRWIAVRERENIASTLDLFDSAMRSIARGDPRIAFFDDRAWFRRTWGGRDADGKPAYKYVSLGGHAIVTNTAGDEPTNAVVADGHAGVVWNALWAQEYIALLNSAFGLNIPPITNEEIVRFVDPGGRFRLGSTP